MTAWQYFAGAGLVAALCPLHGHVAVAGDGHGNGARVDVCVPGGPPKPPAGRPALPPPPVARPGRPSAAPPAVRVPEPGAARPTVRHPGDAPGLPGPPPPPGAPAAAGGSAQPPQAPPATAAAPEPAPAGASAPPGAGAAARQARTFHVRPYHSAALERRGPDGLSTMMLMVVVTTPAVLAAAALRPRSKSRG